jgi:hypothetical protein
MDDAMVAAARSVRIESEIARRGIKLSTGIVERCGPCPVCGGTDRFSINVKKQVWICRKCQAGGDVIELVLHLDGLSFVEAVRLLTGHAPPQKPAAGGHGGRYKDTGAPAKPPEPPPDNRPFAASIWSESGDPRIPLIKAYLGSRRIELPDEAANESIRFHAACPFDSERFPAMVCLVRNIVTNEPQGMHRTALAPDGTAIKSKGKTLRMSLGAISGGAIKLDPDEDIEQGLCIGEGTETCLSGRQMGLKPVWSAVNTGGVANFPMLPGIDGLHIFKENDAQGQSAKAVEACAARWHAAGRTVLIVMPEIGSDLNDEIRAALQ